MLIEIDDAVALVVAVLAGAGMQEPNARGMASAIVAAECDGLWQQGLVQALDCRTQLCGGHVSGRAEPRVVAQEQNLLRADSDGGFVWPAIDEGLRAAGIQAEKTGYCTLEVAAGAYGGVLVQHLEAAADRGLVALGFDPVAADADDAGTPAAMALPRHDQPSLVVELTAADLAQGHLLLACDQSQPLPPAWALGDQGSATTDAGKAAGVGERGRMALVIGLMAAAVYQTASVSGTGQSAWQPIAGGHRFILIDPVRLGATDFEAELDALIALALMDDDRPLPDAERRRARERAETAGLEISDALYQQLCGHAAGSSAAADNTNIHKL